MSEEQFIVAFELGSSRITAAAGYKMPDGSIKVLASAQEPSSSFIRKGAVYNVDLMTSRLEEIKSCMEDKLQRRIDKAYVAIGGMGMHTVSNMIAQQFGEEQTIKQELIDEILEANSSNTYTDREIIDVVPLEYKLGTISQLNPVGVVAESIEGNFLNIILRSSYRKQIEKCFEAAGIHIVELRTVVQTKAGTLLTDDEIRSGCVLVDMGAQSTTVAIYKNNILRHLAALPLGGNSITADISSFNIKEEEAENLKLNFATAISPDNTPTSTTERIVLNDGRNISKSEFNDCVWSRVEEIIRNIEAQVKLLKYDYEQLPSGFIVTGGASKLNKLAQALKELTGASKTRFAHTLVFNVKIDEGNLFDHGNIINESYNTVLALIADGETDCSSALFNHESEETDDVVENTETEQVQDTTQPAEPEAETPAADTKDEEREEPDADKQKGGKKRGDKKPGYFARTFSKLKDTLNDIVAED